MAGVFFIAFSGMQAVKEFKAVHVGKVIVQQEEITLEVSDDVQCLWPAGGQDGFIGGLFLMILYQGSTKVKIVFYY